MSKVIDKIRGDSNLDTTITVKINSERKRQLIRFCKKNKISLGKMIRFGLELVEKEIENEKSVR